MALGFLVSQSWFILLLVVLMMSMHLFGHGHHAGGHSHGDAEDGTGGDVNRQAWIATSLMMEDE